MTFCSLLFANRFLRLAQKAIGWDMKADFIARIATVIAFTMLIPLSAAPQTVPAASDNTTLTAAQIERLVAPIALYPDPLVAQILMAATYPLEIVEAARWEQIPTNAALKADELTAALQQQSWDPSVKSLVSFPQVLQMMDRNLDWTEQLGDAFLAQQTDVMDAIQRLRARARTKGSLASTPQQTVSTENQEIVIEPENPEIVYVPVYNPWCVYGPWPYPDYAPFYFGPWAGYCVPEDYVIAFGPGFYPFGFWAWAHFEWRRHIIRIDRDRFQRFHSGHEPPGGDWVHDPAHRLGVPYRDPTTAARFTKPSSEVRGYRGFAPAPAVTPSVKPAVPSVQRGHAPIGRPALRLTVPQQPVPPAFQSFGTGSQVRHESAHGFSSRMTPAAPAPSFHAAPMPSFHGGGGGGGGGFHGGGGGRR